MERCSVFFAVMTGAVLVASGVMNAHASERLNYQSLQVNLGESTPLSDRRLDCRDAVNNGHRWLDQMRETGDRNYQAGNLSATDYQWGVQALETWSQYLSLQNCREAVGQNLKFFECLADGANHIAVCGRRFYPSL